MKTVSKGQLEFLLGELEEWAADGIVTREQASLISSMYGAKPRSFARVLLSSGAMLVGLGAVCAVAANWDGIARGVRMCMIVGAYALSMLASLVSLRRGAQALSRSLLLLASMVFGAGIFLAAQMYGYDGHWTTAFGWWIVGIIPSAFIFRDRWQCFLAQTLAVCYLGGLDFLLWADRVSRTTLRWEVVPALIIAALWLLWLRLRKDASVFNADALVTAQFAFSRIADRLDPVSATIVFFIAGAAAMLSFRKGDWQELAVSWGTFVCGACGLVLSIPEAWNGFTWLSSAGSVTGAFTAGTAPAQALAAGAALLTAAAMALRLYIGGRTAGIFLALLALRYFVDHFFGFMSKAAAFGVLGAACIAFGLFWERRSRRGGRRNA